jgi:predicted phage gp36 major capsid-like protein
VIGFGNTSWNMVRNMSCRACACAAKPTGLQPQGRAHPLCDPQHWRQRRLCNSTHKVQGAQRRSRSRRVAAAPSARCSRSATGQQQGSSSTEGSAAGHAERACAAHAPAHDACKGWRRAHVCSRAHAQVGVLGPGAGYTVGREFLLSCQRMLQ